MGKNGKRKKNLLKKFEQIDNETLLDFMKQEITTYIKLEKSELIAKKILLKHGINTYGSINEQLKNRFHILHELTNLRNIKIPKSYYQTEISDIDIITRINEFKHEEITWIEKHNYLFDLIDEQNIYPELDIIEMFPDDDILQSDRKISEIISKYEKIIIKEFGQKLLEQYEQLKRESMYNQSLDEIYISVAPVDKIPSILTRKIHR